MNMKKSVLVIGASKELTKTLFHGGGYAPIIQETMRGALLALHNESLTGIVLDRAHAHVDPLELILNVRDIDDEIPIVVIGERSGSREYDELLLEHSTLVLEDPVSPRELIETLGKAFTMAFATERSERNRG